MSMIKNEKLNIKYLSKQDFQKKSDSYEITFTSLGLSSENDCYVIDGLSFEKELLINGNYTGEIMIKNCHFFKGITINSGGLVILENSKLTNYAALTLCSNSLLIKNIEINNHPRLYEMALFISVNDQLQVIDSILGSEHHLPCLYANKELKLHNSMIIGEEINCYADSLIVDDFSSFFATNKIELITNKLSNIKITTPKIIYNNELLYSDNNNPPETNQLIDYFIKDNHHIKVKKRRIN